MPYFPPAETASVGSGVVQSETPPGNPGLGQYWIEITAGGLFVAEWFWNGTYWLSKTIYTSAQGLTTTSATGSLASVGFESFNHNLFLVSCTFKTKVGTLNNTTNYWTGELTRFFTGDVAIPNTQVSTGNLATDAEGKFVITLNSHLNLATTAITFLRARFTKIGSPGTLSLALSVAYRLARA